MKKFSSLVALLLVCCMVLSACGDSSTPAASTPSTQPATQEPAKAPETTTPATQEPASTMKTSSSNKVVNENGTFKVSKPGKVLITSFGQSADVTMLETLVKKVGIEYAISASADENEVAAYDVVLIAAGASSKGLGAAGISEDAEIKRINAITKKLNEKGTEVIVAHIGGSARRGTLSDKFNQLALDVADYIIVVEEGNSDGFFTDFAKKNNVPISLVNSLGDTRTPLSAAFGK